MYDPVIARWTSPDPAQQFFNNYIAMANNPANFVDPDGRFAVLNTGHPGAVPCPWGTVVSDAGASIVGVLATTYLFLNNISKLKGGAISAGAATMLNHATSVLNAIAGGAAGRAVGDGVSGATSTPNNSNNQNENPGNWYIAADNTIQYGIGVSDDSDISPTEQFLGPNHTAGSTEFRPDGSIFFKDETAAYQYMWDNSQRNKRETVGVLTEKGVLVLPEYKSSSYEEGSAKMEGDIGPGYGYNYRTQGSKVFLEKEGESFEVIGLIHTHPFQLKVGTSVDENADLSHEDLRVAKEKLNGKPVIAIGWDNKLYGYAEKDGTGIFMHFSGRTREMLLKGKFTLIKTLLKWKM
jgi:predicted outer membrane repeat protein